MDMENEDMTLASDTPKKRAGRKVFRETRHPVYRGVRRRNKDKWVCELREPISQKRVWLGSYPTPEMAARAHDVAALAYRGRSACLNFADSAWRLPSPVSTDTEDIQKAAAEAAEMFRCGGGESLVEVAYNSEAYSSSSNSSYGDDLFSVGGVQTEEVDTREWLRNMAAEPLMSPPRYGTEEGFMYTEEVEYSGYVDLSLWSYSM